MSFPRLIDQRPYQGRAQVLSIFRAMADADGAVLLDSATHAQGRFDLAAALPIARLETTGAISTLTTASADSVRTCSASTEDPFSLLRKLWQQYKPAEMTSRSGSDLPPFCGGLLMALAYDLGRHLEVLPVVAEADIQIPELLAGIYHWAVIVDHERQHCGLWQFGPAPDTDIEQALRWFRQEQPASLPAFHLQSDWLSNLSQNDYERAFASVQAYIQAGDCYQINLAQRFSAHFSGHPWSAYEYLSAHNQAPFSAYVKHAEGALLSLSPERFIRVENGSARTEPIKGTRPRALDPERDEHLKRELQHSAKDRAENVMIVDLLRNDFGRNCRIGSVKVPDIFAVHSYPAVHHLVSTVTGELADGKDALDLLRGAFPGGSITGAPKIRAMQIIEELEPQRRSYYCGSIGYYDYRQRMDTSITIRTLVCHQDKIHCWAGGGLVADSEVNAEYQETLDKVSKLLPLLRNL